MFLGLTTFNADGEIVAGAAESWETSADGLTWRFFEGRPEMVGWQKFNSGGFCFFI